MSISFRHSAAFGKRIEFYVVGLMLKEGLDVYLPLVDVDAINAMTQEARKCYWFIFFSDRLDMMRVI